MAVIEKDPPKYIDELIHSSFALMTWDCFTNAMPILVLLLSISVLEKRHIPVLDIRIAPYSFDFVPVLVLLAVFLSVYFVVHFVLCMSIILRLLLKKYGF